MPNIVEGDPEYSELNAKNADLAMIGEEVYRRVQNNGTTYFIRLDPQPAKTVTGKDIPDWLELRGPQKENYSGGDFGSYR